jgi:hypothetical protein
MRGGGYGAGLALINNTDSLTLSGLTISNNTVLFGTSSGLYIETDTSFAMSDTNLIGNNCNATCTYGTAVIKSTSSLTEITLTNVKF